MTRIVFFTRYKKEALCVEHIHLSIISDLHLYSRASMCFCRYFLYFLIDLGEIWYRSPVISLSHCEFMKISAVKAMMCLGNKENFTHVFYTVAWFGYSLCERLACNSIRQFQILWKSLRWKPYYITYKNKWNFAHISYIFLLICITFFRRDVPKIWLITSFVKVSVMKAILYLTL
jgi:hypothetical protein